MRRKTRGRPGGEVDFADCRTHALVNQKETDGNRTGVRAGPRQAENAGLGKLDKQELKMLMVLYKEAGSRGNRARRVVDGK